jgi:hypothetical protein
MVGMRGFEPPTSCSRSMRATRLRHIPTLQEIFLKKTAGATTASRNNTCRNRTNFKTGYYFLTAPASLLPALNLATFLAAILIILPV